MLWNRKKLFCEINPLCYKIAWEKEILKRHIKTHAMKCLQKKEKKKNCPTLSQAAART